MEPLSDVSIVIASFNVEKTIAETLESVCRYGGGSELILIDGGSTDETLQIIDCFKERITKLVSEPDKGIYDALSKGFRSARGKWVYVLGGDDVLLPGFLNMAPHLTDPDAVYYGSVKFMPSGRLYGGKTSSVGLLRGNICHQAIFFPKRHWARLGGFDLSFPLKADYALNLKAYWDPLLRYCYVDQIICEYCELGASATRPDPEFSLRSRQLVREYAPRWLSMLFSLKVDCDKLLHKVWALLNPNSRLG